MKERKTFSITREAPEAPKIYSDLLAWKNYIKKLGNDYANDIQREDLRITSGFLSDEDEGMIDGLMANYFEAFKNNDAYHLTRSLSAMQKLIKSRAIQNAASVGVEGSVRAKTIFERIVGDSSLINKTRKENGVTVLSTYNPGLVTNVKKMIQTVVFSPGKKRKEVDTNFFDDGFIVSGEGIQIFNPSMGVDGELILWRDAGTLSFSVDAPVILDFINKPRRVLWGKPKALAPVGVLSIYERSSSTDNESSSKARVLLEHPQDWENLLNQLKSELGKSRSDKVELKRPITWRQFIRLGLFEYNKIQTTSMMDRMLSKIYSQYKEELDLYNQEILRRESH